MSDIKDDLLAKSIKDMTEEIEEGICDLADKLEAATIAAKLWREEALALRTLRYSDTDQNRYNAHVAHKARIAKGLS